MKSIIGIIAMLLPLLSVGQSTGKPLSVGDLVPPVAFSHLANDTSAATTLGSFEGKLVILDFWSSWCSNCIQLFPHMDSLQQRFHNGIQIVLVNTKSNQYKDDAVKIKNILARVHQNTGVKVSLPVVYNCPQLDTYFPCITVPHEVWIGPEGTVAAITTAEDVNPANIQALLDGRQPRMRLKQDRFDVNIKQPLFINGNAGNGTETKYRTLISGYIDGLAGGEGLRVAGGHITGLYAINQSLYSLVKIAWGNSIPFIDNRVVFAVKNKSQFNISYIDTGDYHYQYCYESMLPAVSDSTLFLYMQQDLQRYFNISVQIEKREIACLVLTDSATPVAYVTGGPVDANIEPDALKKYLHHYPVAEAVSLLNHYTGIPIINETKNTKYLSVNLPHYISDTAKLIQAFATAGFRLTATRREVEVTVITDQ